ncbi:MAG: (Fe-S)-binding protein [Methanomassiliicoccus sp.]|nr:(Fe-S)-binding protein [Methanomassiliicoccus sp.]
MPGFNCGRCGHRTCTELGDALMDGESVDQCPFMSQERFLGPRAELERTLASEGRGKKIIGIIDGLEAQFSLLPLDGEPSCREDLYPFDRAARVEKGDLIQYRPLGCPIVHFARVLNESHGILSVHIVGPRRIVLDAAEEPKDIGMCMVAAFEGVIGQGKMPRVGQTVRFLPQHCMMGKVHSGVVVGIEGSKLRIEGIDLKVW